ncbi:Asp23/Gls24 family envelope stress response protein [Streptomyces corynorhini]|uniref:Asp23/Gls24 family envelope stress response protein n=1 Tax=Streptomyces corynorhini TaxID=2282652 RepID=A0A370BG05_9ACTN|nr:Asp23/Gls24 family envelope stress response protein [Streptomyces corynorhini]RDG38365.1 Asp23/Gls24 family envelope stress response protein [Streptomyces corynorhini]
MALNAHSGRPGEPGRTPDEPATTPDEESPTDDNALDESSAATERAVPETGTRENGARENGALDARAPEADDEELLPCGRELSAVWEAWEAGESGLDPHLADCPHCSAALADLAALDDAVREARADDPSDATGLAELTGRVMDMVRLELRPGRSLPLGAPEDDAWIVEAAAARAFRAAAESLPSVRAGSCRIAPLDPAVARRGGGAAGGPADRGPVQVRLEVVAGLQWPLPELAESVRARVAEAAEDAIGIDVARIDVLIVDVLDEEDPAGSGEHQEGGHR